MRVQSGRTDYVLLDEEKQHQLPPKRFTARFLPAVVALLATSTLLATGSSSDAAMAVRITVDPSSPRVGEVARVTVLTLTPFNSYCVNDPRADMRPDSSFRTIGELRREIAAFKDGKVLEIPLTQRSDEPEFWDGDVIFPTSGTWIVEMTHPVFRLAECAGARIMVTVLEREPTGAERAALPIVLAAVGAAVAGFLVIRARGGLRNG